MNLSKNVEVRRVLNGVVAGTSTQTSSAIDYQGYDGALILVSLGAITSGSATTVKVQGSTDDGVVDTYADLLGSLVTVADTDDNKIVVIDHYRPLQRYGKVVITRATQNAVIDSVSVVLYKGRKGPVVQGTTVQGVKLLVSPAEGTA